MKVMRLSILGHLSCLAFLFNRLRIDRRAGAAADDQRRAAKEKLINAVVGAILGQFLDVKIP